MFDQDGTEHDDGASSWQFERGLDFVNSGSEYGFSADVTPEEAGEFTVLVRATYTDDTAQQGEANQESTGGSALDPDQNGYTMKEITIDVEPRNQEPSADAGGSYDAQEGGSVNLDASGSTDSDGYISSESWTVTSGDGYVSGGTYYAPNDITSDGSATVELTVEDDDGATDTDTASITINDDNQPPTPEANGDYTVNEAGSVTLDSAGTSDPDGTVVTESWAVANGPGSVSGLTYEAPDDITKDRTATVKLTTKDDDGDTATDDATVTVVDDNQAPTAKAGGPYSVSEGGSVDLDASGSNDLDGSITSTSWTITSGDGSVSGGTYYAPDDITSDESATVELTVEDDDQATDTDTTSIAINDDNQPPTADAGGSYSVDEGGSVLLDASGSTDSDGSIEDESWRVTNGDGYVSGGTYYAPDDITSDESATVELTVEDDDQATDTDTASIAISDDNQPPTADAGGSYSVSEGSSVNLDASGSNDPDGSIQSRSWTVTSGPGTISGGTYQAPDDVNTDIEARVQLTVVDDDGAPGTDTTTVSVERAAPTASDMDVSTEENSPVSKTFSASDPDDDSLSYTIESAPSDGTVSVSGDSFTYTPESISSGTDSFVYRVDDGNGGTDTATVTIDVSISQDVVDEYNTNGEPGIQIEELNTGIDDYFIDEISIQELNRLIDAYFQQV